MNSNSPIHISQVPSQFFNQDVRLSHKQQLEFENRRERRILRVIGRRLTVKQRAALRFKRSERHQRWKFLEKMLRSLPTKEKAVAGEILKYCRTFGRLTASVETIAARVGCHKNTAQKVFSLFARHGLWVLNKRRWNNSSVRGIHPDFFNPNLYLRLWREFDVYRDYFENADFHLKLWLLFQKDCALELSTYNSSRFSKDDIQLYEGVILTHSRELNITSPKVSNIQSREMDITLNEGSHLLPARKSDMTSRELSQEDTHSRDETPSLQEVPMNLKQIVCSSEVEEIFELSEQLKAVDAEKNFAKPIEPKSLEDLSRQIDEARKSLEPQRAAQRALKAKVASELSEVLKGRVTATLHLSAKGQIYLMRFSDGALIYGLNNLAHHGTIDNRLNFRLFEAACFEYSRLNEIEVYVDRYDNTLKELGYTEAQPLCKKILLERPLSQKLAVAPQPQKAVEPAPSSFAKASADRYQPRRRLVKPPENSGQVAVDHFLQDSFKALADKLGYSEMVSILPQISTESVDPGSASEVSTND